ncbi:MAG: hypothetical protein AMJ62_01380 [Myxococcales bacterium SG8_38]|nr:MAG: hypothetical protein AMJ62_01380 [Myxococcales bacterium SG8_38]
MSLRDYLTPLDLAAILGQLAGLIRMMGGLLLAPAAVGWVSGEFVVAGLLSGLSVLALGLGHWGRALLARELAAREAFLVTALAYPIFSIAGGVAFLPVAPFIDGFFESMSGFTTTGLSVVPIEDMPRTLRFLRSYMQWIGGAGIVILTVALLSATRPAGFRFRLYGSGSEDERIAGSVRSTARDLLKIYALLTGAVCSALVVVGVPIEDAVLHGLATVSTGGFSPHAASIGLYVNEPLVLIVTMAGMLLGATSFSNYQRIARRRKSQNQETERDPQILALAIVVLAGAPLLFVLEGRGWHAAFDTVSAITTTGFSLDDPAGWSPTRKFFTTLWMIIGGSTGSTAGGLKIMRFLVLLTLMRWTIHRLMLPAEARIALKYAGTPIEAEPLRHLLGFIVAYLALLLAGSAALVFAGFNPGDALFESASAVGTVGLSCGITDATLPAWLKLVLSFQMWAGRLEVIPVLVVFYPATWKLRRRSR